MMMQMASSLHHSLLLGSYEAKLVYSSPQVDQASSVTGIQLFVYELEAKWLHTLMASNLYKMAVFQSQETLDYIAAKNVKFKFKTTTLFCSDFSSND